MTQNRTERPEEVLVIKAQSCLLLTSLFQTFLLLDSRKLSGKQRLKVREIFNDLGAEKTRDKLLHVGRLFL